MTSNAAGLLYIAAIAALCFACSDALEVTLCPGEEGVLVCESNLLVLVQNATWGRTIVREPFCSTNVEYLSTECHHDVTKFVASQCGATNVCGISLDPSVFGVSPCEIKSPGGLPLYVSYDCVPTLKEVPTLIPLKR
uniref:SUEL-type lectin domain-containing protein n=1 Tax=Compsopogon caeruleus TaxID=31354 RepID=A0A7S1TIB0_9RHOD|mmetsp:Transcript_8891/g.17928  ORF Transcript_8891/g.17928 Transcript_8891/m.17928 type:complete len:137 (+) Transcript_8891:64-474(+)